MGSGFFAGFLSKSLILTALSRAAFLARLLDFAKTYKRDNNKGGWWCFSEHMIMETDSQSGTELLPLNTIRVETALSRYPVHRLARKGSIKIEVTELNTRGESTLKWKVSYNSDYGQPGPLAYKLDTLIINRRIEEARRPIPRMLKLGSL